MSTLIKSTFPVKEVLPEINQDKTKEYEKKALESIGGSMVFVERNKLLVKKK